MKGSNMAYKIFSSFSICLVAAMCIGLPIAGTSQQTAEPQFSIRVAPEQPNFRLEAEPAIDIFITNPTDRRILLRDTLSAQDMRGIVVKDSEGHIAELQPMYAVGPNGPVAGTSHASWIEPGASRTERIKLRRLYELRRPGEYTVQIHKFDSLSKTTVLSNVASFSITE
jgi:hypothetical protein